MAQPIFQQTAASSFPRNCYGASTSITICRAFNDIVLLFCTQGPYDDQIYLLSRATLDGSRWVSTPPGRETISGFDTDGINPEQVYCTLGIRGHDEIITIDPETGAETGVIETPRTERVMWPQGMGIDDQVILRTYKGTIAIHALSGELVDKAEFPDRVFTGICRFQEGWLAADNVANQLVLFDQNLRVQAAIDVPGPAGGLHAVTCDPYSDMSQDPQFWLPNGGIEWPPKPESLEEGWSSIHHPETPWLPEPRGGRHRIYFANQANNALYAGYLSA